MKIAVLTSRYPYPLEKGDKLRIFNHIRILSEKHEVILISIAENEDYKMHLDKLGEYVSAQHVFVLSKVERALSLSKTAVTKGSFRSAYFYSNRIKRKISKVLTEINPDHIHCHLIRMANYLDQRGTRTSLDYMDCFSAEANKRMGNATGLRAYFFRKEYRRTLHDEAQAFKAFDQHFIISDQDRKLLNVENPAQVKILPNGIDLDFFKLNTSRSPKFDIGFMGNLGYYSNLEAVKFLKQNLIPHVAGLKMLIAGARPPKWVLHLGKQHHIEVVPWLEDIREAYWNIKVFVAPLFKGVGMQNKILEAMACGIPVVTTDQVNNAIGAINNKEILIANTGEEFKNAIHQLLEDKDLYTLITQNASSFVQSNFSWEKQTQVLLQYIDSTNP